MDSSHFALSLSLSGCVLRQSLKTAMPFDMRQIWWRNRALTARRPPVEYYHLAQPSCSCTHSHYVVTSYLVSRQIINENLVKDASLCPYRIKGTQ